MALLCVDSQFLTGVCLFRYTMIGVFPLLFFGWKVLKRTKSHRPEEVDLVRNLDEIEEHEANYRPRPARYVHLELSQSVRLLIRPTGTHSSEL